MRPAYLDNMSWTMAEVYEAVTDRLLINLAKYFPYIRSTGEMRGSFEYQARMLAQIGQVNRESTQIIIDSMAGADAALRSTLEAAIMDALKNEEPKLRRAAEKGLLPTGRIPKPVLSPNQMNAFTAYYRQSADKLNLVNTVMLESTQNAYITTVSDITAKIGNTQRILNTGTGEVVTGVSTWNQAVQTSVKKMLDNGLTGFIDHGGHRWSPEAYAAMDIRTTVFNTARDAVWERANDYGCDLYQVSSHNAARPLCFPWQAKIVSRNDWTGEVEDIDGTTVHVYAQSETSYGEAAGLFGVNCKHYPMTFIPGFSSLKGQPQSEEENEKAYALSQEQRGLERKLREEKRDLEVMKAQGASEEQIAAQKRRVSIASSKIDEFCDEHELPRRRNRESAPIRATWKTEDGTDVTRFDGGYIDANQVPPPKRVDVPPTPIPTPPPPTPTPTPTPTAIAENVASQATPEPPPKVTIEGKTEKLKASMSETEYKEVVTMVDKSPTAKLYEQYGDKCNGITQEKGRGYYSPGFDKVVYSMNNHDGMSKYSTMSHEMAHMFDAKLGRLDGLTFKEADLINDRCVIGSGYSKLIKVVPSSSDQFLGALRKDKITMQTLLTNTEELVKMKTGTMRNASSGVQDAMDGFFNTQDKGILPWGHGGKYYNRIYNRRVKDFNLETKLKDAFNELGFDASSLAKTKKLSRDYETASEAWANVVSAVTCGGSELEAFKTYMPNTVEAVLKIIGGI